MSTYIDFRAVAGRCLATCPQSTLYFLLDHGGLPGLGRQLLRSSLQWMSLFDHSREESALTAAPILVAIGAEAQVHAHRSLFDWISEHGTYTSTVVMLSSPLKIEPLRDRLAARLDVQLSEDMAAMLRFFDPRVLESLAKTLTKDQIKKFFSPAEVWRYVDRCGKIVEITTEFSVGETLIPPLVLAQSQEFALLDASEADQVLDLLRTNTPQSIAIFPPSEQYAFISRAAGLAKQEGVNSISKIAIFCALLLHERENIESQRWWDLLVDIKNEDL